MSIRAFDHVAIPIENVDAMLAFYAALGFLVQEVRPPYFYSVHLNDQKINFHGPGDWRSKFTLRGPTAVPGCGDFCFVWDGSVESAQRHLEAANAPLEEGPVERDGGREQGSAVGLSLYTRDPDGNLLELICYPESSS